MRTFKLKPGLFLYPTPAGAYQALFNRSDDKPRQLLRRLMTETQTPSLIPEQVTTLSALQQEDKALELLFQCRQLGWLQGVEQPLSVPTEALEDLLPPWLNKLSGKGKVLLADDQGFYLASSGFPHEAAEELSALSADLRILHQRRSGLLVNNLGVTSPAWALVDAFGHSQIGFWPLFVGQQTFVIAIAGIPRFNQPELVHLGWTLMHRYARSNQTLSH